MYVFDVAEDLVMSVLGFSERPEAGNLKPIHGSPVKVQVMTAFIRRNQR